MYTLDPPFCSLLCIHLNVLIQAFYLYFAMFLFNFFPLLSMSVNKTKYKCKL